MKKKRKDVAPGDRLAIFGGLRIRDRKFPAHRVIGEAEKKAVMRVLDSQVLSRYLGCWHRDFWGGPEIGRLRKKVCAMFGVEYALPLNSATSGLFAALGAVGAEPGDEVICSPYTMSASVTCCLANLLVPVFADIEPYSLCLSPESVAKRITKRTKAIVVVHLMGHPADMDAIMELAKPRGIKVIEDCAQAPGSFYKGRRVGTLGQIGVFSLNYHKHIHTGEGGIAVTGDRNLFNRMALIHNHAESVLCSPDAARELLDGKAAGLFGGNLRMGEMEAAMAVEQLRKLDGLIGERNRNCGRLASKLSGINFLRMPEVEPGCVHSFYTFCMGYDAAAAGGVHRDRFVEAVRAELPETELREAEGPLLSAGYLAPLYLLPVFQEKRAFGKSRLPWSLNKREIPYGKGLCPVTEHIQDKVLVRTELMRPGMSPDDIDDVARAFEKVARRIGELAG